MLFEDALFIFVFFERESIGENREDEIERHTTERLRGIWWTISSGGSDEADESLGWLFRNLGFFRARVGFG